MKQALSLLAMMAVAACSKGAASEISAVDAGAGPPQSGRGWLEEVRGKAASQPALLVWSRSGRLVAQRPSGDVIASIAGPASSVVAFEPRADLIWIRAGADLFVMDLRTPTPKAEPIVTGAAAPTHFSIHAKTTKYGEYALSSAPCSDEQLTLNWSAKPTVSVAGAKIVGQGWLDRNLERPLNALPDPQSFEASSDYDEVKLPSRQACDSPNVCGRAQDFGTSGWQLVLVGSHLARCPGKTCLLRDRKAGLYATPMIPPTWGPFSKTKPGDCGRYYFERGRQSFFSDTQVCNLDGTCKSIDGRPLAWLQPGPSVGDPD